MQNTAQRLLGLWCSYLEDEEELLELLNYKKENHLDTSVICTAAREGGIEKYNPSTPEAPKIVKLLQVDLKAHYRDHKTKQDEYLLSKVKQT